MKIVNIIFRVLLALLTVSPILGVAGVFPAPTADMYNTAEAYNFIVVLMDVGYINYIMAAVFLVCFVLTIMNRMALVALLLLPITVNIVGFHLFLDGGLLNMGSLMANILLVINVWFLWVNRRVYKALLVKSA